ncbi:MAG: hypothetical protein J6W82_11495 [Bacteroidales bacterium]|nr:hypothetical protein [Bacteroidales bacterium]
MRKLITYLTALFLAASCMAELEPGGTATGDSLEGAPVMITFSVPDIPLLPATKSLEEGDGDITDTPYLDPEKMYVVVCGGSQSIKYIRKAKLKGEPLQNYEIPPDKYPLPEGDRHVTLYEFEVELELSDFERTIHILGNVDENQLITGSYAYNSLPNMLSYDNKQAYWQRISVPYIKAQIDPETNKPKTQDGRYVPTDETKGFFQYIPLIRNFAKIQVTNAAESFQLHSYAVIFFPEKGSVAPYRSNEPVKENRFDFNPPSGYLLSGYERSTFDELDSDIQYLGNMPTGVALSDVIPPASEFEDPSSSGGRVLKYDPTDTDSGFYVYERGVPTDKIGPTFIIICGKFEKEDTFYYYRLDLMESKVEGTQTVSKYYPIYRNFRYNIQLHRISSEGVLTPELAAVSSGAEDISADVSMRHLSDISNGTTRLVVEPFMTRTYSGPSEDGYYELFTRFFNNVYSDVPNLLTAAVKVELEPMTDGSDDILILYDGNGNRVPKRGFFFPEAATVGGVPGIRTIHFDTVDPLDETKTQKIKITGHNPGNHQDLRLYREVEITLQKKQPLTVSCTNPVQALTNSPITASITIPSELPESMFPLEFIVEPEAKTLTPDTSKDVNMPVVSGRSIATTESAFTDTPTFYYIRTLTWEEFTGLPIIGNKRTFNCYFKTNREFNATTIWVYNEYFTKGSTSFKNKLPLNLSGPESVLAVEDTPVALALSIHSGLQKDMFPMRFIVEPEDETLTLDITKGVDMHIEVGRSIATDAADFKDTYVYQFIRTLSWDEYSSLPVNENLRTFYCYFKTSAEESATTIWVYNENFFKSNVSFYNIEEEPTNHFYVSAEEDCAVLLNYDNLWYKIDDGNWEKYTKNTSIELTAGHKISFKGGSKKSKMTRTTENAFSCTGGKFKVGGNFASLMVGDDYPKEGADKTGDRFINFFKGHTNLIDASKLELPMLTLSTNAYKSMFDGCTNLVRGPQYLPATTLGATCYRNMFYNCKNLEYAPELPATTLVSGAYQRMFWGCSKLNHIKMLGTTWRSDTFVSDNTNWCAGVASEGEIWLNSTIKDASNWNTTWGTIIPAGWTVKYVGIDDVEQP